MNECIQIYINNLPENYKSVLILSDYQNLKNKDIAKILGISLETAKIRLHRARRKLKENMTAGCEIYENDGELGCDKKLVTKAIPNKGFKGKLKTNTSNNI